MAFTELPSDYEACDTCGYDHEYDLPYLDDKSRCDATKAHVLATLPSQIAVCFFDI